MHRLFAWFRLPGSLVLTALMSLLALILFLVRPSAVRLLAFVGMLFWSLGDIVLMNYPPLTNRLPFQGFAAGGTCFMIGHLFFFAAFLIEHRGISAPFFNGGVGFALGLWLLCCVAMAVFKRPSSREWNLFPLFCLYLLAMTLVGVGACSCAFAAGGRFWLAAVGFVLFLLSDEAIGLGRISGIAFANWDDIIWTLYPLGVIGVILGV